MSFEVRCPGCSKTYTLAQEYAGKKVRCKKCQTSFETPSPDEEFEIALLRADSSGENSPFDVDTDARLAAPPAVQKRATSPGGWLRIAGICGGTYLLLLIVGFVAPRIGVLLMLCVGLLGIGLIFYGLGSFFMALERGQRFWMAARILLRFVGLKLISFDASLWNPRTKRALGITLAGILTMMLGAFPAGMLAKLATSKPKPAKQNQIADKPMPPAGFPGAAGPPIGFPPGQVPPRGLPNGAVPPGAFPGAQPPVLRPPAGQDTNPRDPPIDSLDQALAWLADDDVNKSGPAARHLWTSRVVSEHTASATTVADKLLDRWQQGWNIPVDFFRLLHKWVTADQVPRLAAMLKVISPGERDRLYSCLKKTNSLEAAEVLEREMREHLQTGTGEGHQQALIAANFLCEMTVAEPVLLRWAGHPEFQIYNRMLHSLGRFGTEKSLPLLKELAGSNEDPGLRSAAYTAVRSIERRLQKAAKDAG